VSFVVHGFVFGFELLPYSTPRTMATGVLARPQN
jgi:hypothetical protein